MTEKARRIERALDKLNLQKADLLTVGQLEQIAKLADVRTFEVMIYLRCR